MAGTRPRVVTMSLNTVPPVDCKCAAAAAGPSSRLAQSDRFVRLLSTPLVELPLVTYGNTYYLTTPECSILYTCVSLQLSRTVSFAWVASTVVERRTWPRAKMQVAVFLSQHGLAAHAERLARRA